MNRGRVCGRDADDADVPEHLLCSVCLGMDLGASLVSMRFFLCSLFKRRFDREKLAPHRLLLSMYFLGFVTLDTDPARGLPVGTRGAV